jgi:hypothetical protein
MAPPARRGFGYYVRRAFVEKWNVGLFLAAVGFAALSPFPDALLPIVVGLEGLFLLGMAGNPRFRQAMDAETAKTERSATDITSTRSYLQMIERLDAADRARFRQHVLHCQQMQSLASGVQGGSTPADAMRESALNRLLFFHLRLLITRDSLRTFLTQSDVSALRDRRARVQEQLTAAEAANEERLKASLRDTLNDLETRITNVEKGLKDANYLDIELQRIEGKAQALAEAAITRQDPTELAAQVTAFTDTLRLSEDVEARMVSLQGLELASTDAPAILNSPVVRADA